MTLHASDAMPFRPYRLRQAALDTMSAVYLYGEGVYPFDCTQMDVYLCFGMVHIFLKDLGECII